MFIGKFLSFQALLILSTWSSDLSFPTFKFLSFSWNTAILSICSKCGVSWHKKIQLWVWKFKRRSSDIKERGSKSVLAVGQRSGRCSVHACYSPPRSFSLWSQLQNNFDLKDLACMPCCLCWKCHRENVQTFLSSLVPGLCENQWETKSNFLKYENIVTWEDALITNVSKNDYYYWCFFVDHFPCDSPVVVRGWQQWPARWTPIQMYRISGLHQSYCQVSLRETWVLYVLMWMRLETCIFPSLYVSSLQIRMEFCGYVFEE